MSGILNNFMASLQPMRIGAFNPNIDHRYNDLGGLGAMEQTRDAIARSKVEDMIRQAQEEGRPINEYESALISRVNPNATTGYNNSLITQNNLESNKITQSENKQKLENQWISDTARILKNSDPSIKSDVYKRQIKKAMDMGIHDETDPTEYSPEIENQLVAYSEAMLQEQKDARSYGNAGGATGEMVDRLRKENPKLSMQDALLIVQGIGRKGLKPTGDGGVSAIDNFGDELGGIEGTVAKNKAEAVLPAKQEEQDIINTGKVNSSKTINDDLQATKSYYENLRVRNENNAKLTLQERKAKDMRLQKERDAELKQIQSDYANKLEIEKQKQIGLNKNEQELNQKDALRIQGLKQNLPIAEEVTANAIAGIDDTIGKLEQVKGMVGANTAGWGSLLAGLPASDANDLDAQLLTVNSRFGLDRLLSLKNQGGSLGQIAVKEFEALQSSVSNLRQSQSAEQLRRNIDDAIRQSQRTQESIERAYLAEYGDVLGQSQEQQPQQGDNSQQRIRTYNPETGELE